MDDLISLDYGSGGKKTAALIEELILPAFGNPVLSELGDGAVLPGTDKIVFSTDSFVVSPLFFPGGDIGKLSVCGTLNDVAMAGGEPLYLSLALVIEEGLPADTLRHVLASAAAEAKKAGVSLVTGDTKVVEKGSCDQLFINTAGIGRLVCPGLSPRAVRPGDKVIVSGPIGNHGITVMLARHPDFLSGSLQSDCACVAPLARKLFGLGDALRMLRDPTRGGIATALAEIVKGRAVGCLLEEELIPVEPAVSTACELLGLDPLYSANEGRLLAIVAPDRAEEALSLLGSMPEGEGAAVIGRITEDAPGRLRLRTRYGSSRVLSALSGSQFPRIC